MRILRFIRGGQPGKQVGISKTRQIALPATVLTIGVTGTISQGLARLLEEKVYRWLFWSLAEY